MEGPSASWSWFPSVLERVAPTGSFVDDPFDPGDSSVSFIDRPVASLLDEIDLAEPVDATFLPSAARPPADLDDPFSWRPVHSPQAAVEQAFAHAVDASDFLAVSHSADIADLAEWSLGEVDPLAPINTARTLGNLDHQLNDRFDSPDLDELDADDLAVEFELDEDLGDDLSEDTGDDTDDAGAEWFDL